MNAVGIIGMFAIMIILESVTDGLYYLSWIEIDEKSKSLGILHHLTQIALLLTYGIFGYLYDYPITFPLTIYLFIGYILIRFGIFDWLYIQITGIEKSSQTDLFDKITGKLPLFDNMLIRLLIAFAGIILICIFF